MSDFFDVLWLTTSPSLKYFDRPLIRYIAEHINIAQWEYIQSLDEGSTIDKAVELLYVYLKQRDSPIHLIGHGISGVVGLIFARRYPQLAKSLTLLAVGAKPAMTWHSHYLTKIFPAISAPNPRLLPPKTTITEPVSVQL